MNNLVLKIKEILRRQNRKKLFKWAKIFTSGIMAALVSYLVIHPAMTIDIETAEEMPGIYLEEYNAEYIEDLSDDFMEKETDILSENFLSVEDFLFEDTGFASDDLQDMLLSAEADIAENEIYWYDASAMEPFDELSDGFFTNDNTFTEGDLVEDFSEEVTSDALTDSFIFDDTTDLKSLYEERNSSIIAAEETEITFAIDPEEETEITSAIDLEEENEITSAFELTDETEISAAFNLTEDNESTSEMDLTEEIETASEMDLAEEISEPEITDEIPEWFLNAEEIFSNDAEMFFAEENTFETEITETEFAEQETESINISEPETESINTSEPETEETETMEPETETAALPAFLSGRQTVQVEGADYSLEISVPESAQIPDDASLSARTIEDETLQEAALAFVETEENEAAKLLASFRLQITDNLGNTIEPEDTLEISVDLGDEVDETASVFSNTPETDAETSGNADVRENELERTVEGSTVTFEADGNSDIAIVVTTIEKYVLASDGHNYKISVTYGTEAGIPEGARLYAAEIKEEDTAGLYDDYLGKIKDALHCETDTGSYIRLFDIKILDAEENKVEITAPVDVRIALADQETAAGEFENVQVVHFSDEAETPDIVENVEVSEAEEESLSVLFEASGFSVYAIVEAPEMEEHEIRTVKDLAELNENLVKGFYLSVKNPPSYFSSMLNKNSSFIETEDYASAGIWFFEQIEETSNYLIYTNLDGKKQYIRNTSGNLAGLAENNGTAFEISQAGNGLFYFKKQGENRWLQHSNSGSGIRFYTDNNDAANSRITITYADSLVQEKDPFELDGKSFGIAYHNDTATSAALMAQQKDNQHLAARKMIMRPDVTDHEGILLVAENSEITEWTFQSVKEDKYYITAPVNGRTNYLTLNGSSLTLTDNPVENSLFTITSGTGAESGKYCFSVGAYSIVPHISGNDVENGFQGSNRSEIKWLNLVERSDVLNDDDFTLYNAKKVSVSDTEQVFHKKQVILYTRIWNDTKKKYEFYAVDHDGSMIPCYDTGDGIEWIGTKVNTALWEFAEGTNPDGSLSYYYWLKNAQYKTEYLVPQVTSGQVIYHSQAVDSTEDFEASVNLNGRRFGETFTTIITWDDSQYSYSGLKTVKTGQGWQVVPCALSEADDFYFAIMNLIDQDDIPSTVATIDSEAYGISLKMIDFNNRKTGTSDSPRDSVQNPFFGGDNNNAGLLSSNLEENGYPVTTSVTNNAGHSLAELFSDMQDVNHLFINSIYNESGYFEYDSTSNFARLNQDGTFTVYDQLGAIGNYGTVTGTHGQFMPYNDLVPGEYCSFTNQTDVLAQALSDLDPRKGEKLYHLGNRNEVNYHFGMEMSAGFTQTADGLDAWGHDIIFEFSGDDDFWFYVDGELILDLGGVHSAMTGSINFRTGEVKSSRGNKTLYDIFKSNFQARGMDAAAVALKLDGDGTEENPGIFEEKTVDGKKVHVFRDYSNHEMRMFYMERGAGASNLHMRFNLASVKPGTVVLSKNLSGTESGSNSLIEFPYQIYYTVPDDGGDTFHLLTEKTEDVYNVTYKDTVNPVKYSDSITLDDTTYRSVFFLTPGQSAVIDLPDNTLNYYIVECGINTNAYDTVKVNGIELSGTPSGAGSRQDFATSPDTMENRPKVSYDNHVKEGAMRSLSLTKILYDANGEDLLHYDAENGETEDRTLFSFRLYLGNLFTDEENIPAANLYPYYVKNRYGEYCSWDAEHKRFVSLEISEFEELSSYLSTLTKTEQETIIFRTSPNGSISKIPADYTVEVRDLITGTHWKVEERDAEIPKGYTMRLEDGYTRVDTAGEQGYYFNGTTPLHGTLSDHETPELQVRNQKGWGLTVQKIWTDKDFMEAHDAIYFAVYVKNTDAVNGNDASYTLLENSVREMKTSKDSVYYFFDNLQSGIPFDNYDVYEVTVNGNYSVDADGIVTGYTSVDQIRDGGTLKIGGTPAGGTYHTPENGYSYTVTYQRGEQTTQNENVRMDTVTNSRPGIKLYKKDWNWETPLAHAVFTLKDANGNQVAASQYVSGSTDGLITIAYLNAGEYTLTETASPNGYVSMGSPMTISVDEDGTVSAFGPDTDLFTVRQAVSASESQQEEMAVITIRNRPAALQIKKVDASTDEAIKNVHFALYNQVMNSEGELVRNYFPVSGYEDLVTDENGYLNKVSIPNLTWGDTYYLVETKAAEGYEKCADELCFTIGTDGIVTVNSIGHSNWLTVSDPEAATGTVTYTITIPNSRMKKISFQKVDIVNPDHSTLLGAEFDLYSVIDGQRAETPIISGLVSTSDGMLSVNGKSVFGLPEGVYHLMETKAPSGYTLKAEPVVITVTDETDSEDICFNSKVPVAGVSYDEGTELSSDENGIGDGIQFVSETSVYTLRISNISCVSLPATGGTGTRLFYLAGFLLMGFGAILLICRRRTMASI